MILFIALIVNT